MTTDALAVFAIVWLYAAALAGGESRTHEKTDVAAFVAAHYDEYVIDTFAVEPTVEATVVTSEFDVSYLVPFGIDTTGLVPQCPMRLPIYLIDILLQLPNVDTVIFHTWQEKFDDFVRFQGNLVTVDTSGAEPLVEVYYETVDGDYSQLDSLGVQVLSKRHGKGSAMIPYRLIPELTGLETIKSISILTNDIHPNQSPEGAPPPAPPAVGATLFCFFRGYSAQSAAFVALRPSDSVLTDTQCADPRSLTHFAVDSGGSAVCTGIAEGIYDMLVFQYRGHESPAVRPVILVDDVYIRVSVSNTVLLDWPSESMLSDAAVPMKYRRPTKFQYSPNPQGTMKGRDPDE